MRYSVEEAYPAGLGLATESARYGESGSMTRNDARETSQPNLTAQEAQGEVCQYHQSLVGYSSPEIYDENGVGTDSELLVPAEAPICSSLHAHDVRIRGKVATGVDPVRVLSEVHAVAKDEMPGVMAVMAVGCRDAESLRQRSIQHEVQSAVASAETAMGDVVAENGGEQQGAIAVVV